MTTVGPVNAPAAGPGYEPAALGYAPVDPVCAPPGSGRRDSGEKQSVQDSSVSHQSLYLLDAW